MSHSFDIGRRNLSVLFEQIHYGGEKKKAWNLVETPEFFSSQAGMVCGSTFPGEVLFWFLFIL